MTFTKSQKVIQYKKKHLQPKIKKKKDHAAHMQNRPTWKSKDMRT